MNGIEQSLHPLTVVKTTMQDIFNDVPLYKGDVILIDHGNCHIYFEKEWHRSGKGVTIAIINTTANKTIDFSKFYPSCCIFGKETKIDEFRMEIKNSPQTKNTLQGKGGGYILSPREHQIIIACIGGKTVQEISRETGLKNKAVYSYRKSACLKLGVAKFRDLAPFSTTLLITASISSNDDMLLTSDCGRIYKADVTT
ncbi:MULTISPECIES: helix-turn-helix transcriptional regulator [Enterobacter]|uniref:helix-turn-helix transcriptional regulator n=1 Tax=Enterobacter TaxID=547 RepID=UPI001F32304F|nr:helix-turn-helix domain-containing protein [Enterobacter quasiroggenkampii]